MYDSNLHVTVKHNNVIVINNLYYTLPPIRPPSGMNVRNLKPSGML